MDSTYKNAKMVLVPYEPQKFEDGLLYTDTEEENKVLKFKKEFLEVQDNEVMFHSGAYKLWLDFVKPYIVIVGTIKPNEEYYDARFIRGFGTIQKNETEENLYGYPYYKILALPEQIAVMKDNHGDDSELKYFTEIDESIIEAIVFENEGKCSIEVQNLSPGFDHNGECLGCDAWPSECECFRVRTAEEYKEYFYKSKEGDENKVVIFY